MVQFTHPNPGWVATTLVNQRVMAGGVEDVALFAHSSDCAIVRGLVRAGLSACPACGGPRTTLVTSF
eukprot:gene4966-biopygen6565